MATAKARAASGPEVEEMVVPGTWKELAPGKVAWQAGHAKEVCGECGVHPLDPSTTGWTCEHRSVVFQNPLAVKPEGTTVVKEVNSGDLRQQIAALMAQAEAMESAEGARH